MTVRPAVANLLALLCCWTVVSLSGAQSHGLAIHNFFTNPFVKYPGAGAKVRFTNSEVWSVNLTQPVIFGAQRTQYRTIYLHKKIPGFVFLQNPTGIPEEIEEAYPSPYIKVLSEFRDRAQDEVQFYARVYQSGDASESCLDKKFASKFKDEANKIFDFGGGYFSPQSIVSVAFRRPAGLAMGGLAELVLANSGFETVAFLHYGNLQTPGVAMSALQEAGFFGASPLALPTGFSGQSNVAQPGSWVFRTSDRSVPGGIASANVDQALRRNMDQDNNRLGFLADRMVGCKCGRCHSGAVCVNIGSGSMRLVEGTTKCCRCQGNGYIGNGLECADVGSPLPVTFRSIAEASGSATAGIQVNASLVQGYLDISVQPSSSPADTELMNLVKLSEAAWGNMALLTASAGVQGNRTGNLFSLGDSFQRRVNFTLMDMSGTILASWAVNQSVWNQVLFKATSTRLVDKILGPQFAGMLDVLSTEAASSAVTEYSFTVVQRDHFRLVSKPANYTAMALTPEMPQELVVSFTDEWNLRPTCDVETRVRPLMLQRKYDRGDPAGGIHLTRLTGTLSWLVTCADLTCGEGSECRQNAIGGPASCQCLPNYRRDSDGSPDGPCRPVCGSLLCHAKAECLFSSCVCAAGYTGDGVTCTPDPLDCRLSRSACRTDDGVECVQQTAAVGLKYRCQCRSSKCVRDTDQQCLLATGGCSKFADCVADINECVCKANFTGSGKTCVPSTTCANNTVCADVGQFAFCNATQKCEVCAPPKVVRDGRCQQQPCRPGDCHQEAECNPVTNACVCQLGFTGDGVTACSLACSVLGDCNRDVGTADLQDLGRHMACRDGACMCLTGFRPNLDKDSRVLSCRNCESDLDCLSGATCQFEMRFSNARLCKCPEGKFGDGASACHECDERRRCGPNAECEAMPTGSVCRCKYGHSGPNPKAGCAKDDTRLMLNVTQLQLYEGQTDISVSCRVIRGPVRPVNLVWSSIREVPVAVFEEGRVTQFLLGDRKLLRFDRVTKADAREYFCYPDVEGETNAAEALRLTVLDNPCRQCHPLAFCNYTRPGCECSHGYSGDGVARCDRASCTEQPLCDPATELCLYSQQTGKYGCECLQGLERVDGRCQRRKEACVSSVDCHASADCALVDGRRQCRCREGFSGDGLRHCERSGPGCNFHNRCAQNAECLYSRADGKYRCVCLADHIGNGDAECRRQANCAECEQNQGACVSQSVEHRTADGRSDQVQLAVCSCPDGTLAVLAKGRTVCRSPAQMNRTLYLAQGDSILRVPAETSDEKGRGRGVFIAMSSASGVNSDSNSPRAGGPVVALDYNCRSREIIWSVYGHRKLYLVKVDKAGEADRSWVPFGDGMEMVEGLAVDWTTGNIYYTAQYVSTDDATRGVRLGEVGVIANRRGVAYRKVLFKGKKDGVVRPRGIAVDPFLGKIYYTDWDRSDPRIMTAFMNGEGHTKLTGTDSYLPNDVVRRFDSSYEEVCYAAADLPLNKTLADATSDQRPLSQLPVQCVWRIDPAVEYVERRNYRTQWLGEPFGLAYADGQFYWTNWRTNKLASFSVGPGQATDRGVFGSADNRLMGIAAVSSDCPTTALGQKSDHACSENREYGGCKYLCLAAPNGGVKCACPDDNPACTP